LREITQGKQDDERRTKLDASDQGAEVVDAGPTAA
jgi:hypothetical protein